MKLPEPIPPALPWLAFVPSPQHELLAKYIMADGERLTRCCHAALKRGGWWSRVAHVGLCVVEDSYSFVEAVAAGRIRAAHMLARATFEGSLNTMRIAIGGEEVADRASRHAYQKFFRSLDRSTELNGTEVNLKWTPPAGLQPTQKLLDAIEEFTHKSGTEKTGWIDENVQDKMSIVATANGGRSDILLQMAMTGCYRHASEVIHGTLCGALHSFGESGPPTDAASASDPRPGRRAEQVTIHGQSVLVMLSQAVNCLSDRLDAKALGEESQKALFEFLELSIASFPMRNDKPSGGWTSSAKGPFGSVTT